MHYIISIFLALTFLTGCGAPRYSDFFLYRDDGSSKPKIVLLPVQGEPTCREGQIENAIIANARERGELFFYTQEEVQTVLTRYSISMEDELSIISRYFCPADYVVEATLIADMCVNAEHLEIPVIRKNPQEHMVRLRLQIMDIRSGNPKMVLLEVIEERELIITREGSIDRPSIYALIAEKAAARIEDRVLLCQQSLP